MQLIEFDPTFREIFQAIDFSGSKHPNNMYLRIRIENFNKFII